MGCVVIRVEKMSAETAVHLGGLSGPALFVDPVGTRIQANEAAIELLGSAWEDVAASLIARAESRGPSADAHHCILTFDAPDGMGRHFAVHLSYDKAGCGLMLIAEEVPSDLVPSASLEEILESIQDSFFALDADGTFVFANSRAAESLGVAKRELLGRALGSFDPLDKAFAEARSAAMERRETTSYDVRVPGQERWIEVRAYPAGEGMAVYYSDITDRVQAQEELTFMALHDALTKLPNRSYFQEQLKKAVARSKRGVPSALLFMDMDRFKNVNDTVGHAAGDAVLIQFADLVSSCAREEDTLARIGGDEFALLLENTPADAALEVAERILRTVQEHEFEAAGQVFSLGVSIGLSPVYGTGAGGHVMAQADTAMYEAKHHGGERVWVAPAEPADGAIAEESAG